MPHHDSYRYHQRMNAIMLRIMHPIHCNQNPK